MKQNTSNATRRFLFGAILSFISSLASADQAANEGIEYANQRQNIRAFFLLNNNDVPAFWGNPVVSSFFDETGDHSQIFEKARAQAMFYSMASRVDTAYSENTDVPPSLAYVVADYQIDGFHLAQPLRQIIQEKWANTPIFEALQEPETRTQANGIPDGAKCSVFVSGTQHDETTSYYVVESAIILASSNLSKREIALCFQNKTALIFGAASSNFDFDIKADSDVLKGIYFSLVPTFLELGSVCRENEFATTLNCVVRSMNERYGHLLEVLNQ